MKHIAIYSLSLKEVRFEKEIKDGSVVKDEVEISVGSEHLADTPLIDYEKWRYENECRNLGGDWKIYCADVPFSWDAVTPKEVTNEEK